jgi:hypothetical protein
MALLLYGAGLRLLECCRLRVKDVDFAANQIVIRNGKGGKDRVMLPAAVKSLLRAAKSRFSRSHTGGDRPATGDRGSNELSNLRISGRRSAPPLIRNVGLLTCARCATRSKTRPMANYQDHHAMIFLPPDVAGPIEAARRDWDPDMADRIAAHVTLVYPQEAPISDLLFERVRAASHNSGPFRLRLGDVACFERPEGGVYVNVADVDGGYRKLREEVLRPPFHGIAYPAHVTLVHPRTSRRGRELWDSGAYQRQD